MGPELIARCQDRIATLADASLGRARTEDDLADLLSDAWVIVGEELAAGRPSGTPPPACGPGCAACCTVNVGTLALEGAVAARHLRRSLPASEVPAVAARLEAFHDRVRWLEDRERIATRLACPLADASARCTIHPARPMACRSVTSLDPAECRRALATRVDAEDEDAGVVRMDWLQKTLHDVARVTLADALAARGLDARCRDVSGMTAVFLADPARAARFLAGAATPIE